MADLEQLPLLSEASTPREPEVRRTAVLSACGTYRYRLTRSWGLGLLIGQPGVLLSRVLWVMLNPSTADHEIDDPTIRRCMAFTARWGFHALAVVNLFALRTPHPRALKAYEGDRIGPLNDEYIDAAAEHAGLVVAAWGTNGDLDGRAAAVASRVRAQRPLHVLGLTKAGHPVHPMARGKHRVPDDRDPIFWRPS